MFILEYCDYAGVVSVILPVSEACAIDWIDVLHELPRCTRKSFVLVALNAVSRTTTSTLQAPRHN